MMLWPEARRGGRQFNMVGVCHSGAAWCRRGIRLRRLVWACKLASTVCAVILMFLVPRNALPAAALWLLVLLPVGYMHIPKVLGQYFAPSVARHRGFGCFDTFAHRMIPVASNASEGWLISGPFLFLFLLRRSR